jgi:hypothetical protein
LGAIVIVWIWWLELWLSWFAILEDAQAPPPPTPPDRHNVTDLADWRRNHPKSNGYAA